MAEEAEGAVAADVPVPEQDGAVLTAGDMRRLLLIAFLYPFLASFICGIVPSFLRTSVHCHLPRPSAQNDCPVGAVYGTGRCEPAPPGSSSWSLSAHCADRAHVVSVGTRQFGQVSIVVQVGGIVTTAVVASQMDVLGRKPMHMLSVGGCCAGGLLLFASTFMAPQSRLRRTTAVVLAPLSFSVTNVFAPTCRAMVADLTASSAAARSSGFAALQVVGGLGAVCSVGICALLLSRDSTDYRGVWGAYTALCAAMTLVVAIFIRETLPKAGGGSKESDGSSPSDTSDGSVSSSDEAAAGPPSHDRGSAAGRAGREMLQAVELVRRDPFLGHAMLIGAVMAAISAGMDTSMVAYQLEVLGYTQAMTQVSGEVGIVAGLAGSAACPRLVRLLGSRRAAGISLWICSLGYALQALSGASAGPGGREALFWSGFVLATAAKAVFTVSLLSLTSLRVGRHSQGKWDALSSALLILGGVLGTYLWTHRLYSGAAGRWRAGLIFWAAAGGALLALACLAAACLLQRRRDAAAAALASAAREPGSEFSDGGGV